MFEYYEAETKNGQKLRFRKLHELERSHLTRVAELLAEEWEERTAAGQVTFRNILKISLSPFFHSQKLIFFFFYFDFKIVLKYVKLF